MNAHPLLPVIVDTRRSAAAKLQQVPITSVMLSDTFWSPRLRANCETTIPSQYRHLEETGCVDNFRRASGRKEVPFRGPQFADSDLYKWLEAASWALAAGDNPPLSVLVEEAITEIAAAQQPDGYLNTYFMFERASERWATINFGFNNMHELYSAGHLFQAAVAHHRVTGSTRLLEVVTRLADHVCDVFGPGKAQRHGVDAHPEIEMPLVELYRITGNLRYLAQAQYFIDARRGMGRINGAVYPFLPLREYERMEGHAVCAVYLTSGVTDLYAETGEATLKTTLDALWNNMTEAQVYLTGGIGPHWDNEAFGADYELPPRAYAETCASIGSIMWNARMLTLEPEAKYADLIERTLYNAFLSGISLSGIEYFYQNPLADDGRHRREAWFGCACCPPNVARLLAQLPGYFYSVTEGNVFVNLYAESRADLTLPDGQAVSLSQTTNYPWDGRIRITVETGGRFALNLRVPGWAMGARLSVNGQEMAAPAPGTYALVTSDWNPGDVVEIALPMPVRRIAAHPRVSELTGRVALMRGPLVYCFEQADNPRLDIRDIRLPHSADLQALYDPETLGGVMRLHGSAAIASGEPNFLYRDAASALDASSHPAAITAIPYYAWANRSAGPMTVWVRAE